MATTTNDERAAARNRARRRRVQGAALSGGALLAGQLATAGPAQAATFTVTSLLDDDGAGLTLREAVVAANGTAAADTINFTVNGTIELDLAKPHIPITESLTITGPGAAALTVDGNQDDRIFYIQSDDSILNVTITGLTLTQGEADDTSTPFGDSGGAILSLGANLTLDDMVVNANTGAEGGGIWTEDGTVTITDSVISHNIAIYEGGGLGTDDTEVVISNTIFSDNTSGAEGGGAAIEFSNDDSGATISDSRFTNNSSFDSGGGLAIAAHDLFGEGTSLAPVTVKRSLFEFNNAADGGGLAGAEGLDLNIELSVFTENDARFDGGGVALDGGEGGIYRIADSTMSGNDAGGEGGGLYFGGFSPVGGELTVERSTISGNTADQGGGVGIDVFDYNDNGDTFEATFTNSTISGNLATGGGNYYGPAGGGGGVFINATSSDGGEGGGGADIIPILIEHSTIADNDASYGGGVYNDFDNEAIVTLDHTIVADNEATINGDDLSGTFDANWNLILDLDSAILNGANNIIGDDPELEPLADNGGPTLTHMIPLTSPAFNAGDLAFAPPPVSDQRGVARVSGEPGPNRRIDIGAVERQLVPSSLPGIVGGSVNWHLRESLTTGPISIGPFVYGARPQTVIMGDWNNDGVMTPGTFSNGVFKLRNSNDTGGPDITFTFGDKFGFPVAGDWDGDGDDDVAVYRAGKWEVRDNDTAALTVITGFGTGSWPATVPVAGDWDNDASGKDGIGFVIQSTGVWTIKQEATQASAAVGPFTFLPAAGSYPVAGDWDGDGFDTPGAKINGSPQWHLSNVHLVAPGPVPHDPVYDFQLTLAPPTGLAIVWEPGIAP